MARRDNARTYGTTWQQYQVTGVWKGARYGFGCFAREASGRSVALVGDANIALRKGMVLQGQAVPGGDWHGTPMMRMEELLMPASVDEAVDYMVRRFQLEQSEASDLCSVLGRNAPFRLLSGERTARTEAKRTLTSSTYSTLAKHLKELADMNPVRRAYPFLSKRAAEAVCVQYSMSRALDALQDNPYEVARLVDGFRFPDAERVFFANGGDHDATVRVDALLEHALKGMLNRTGDTCLNASDDVAFGAWMTEAQALSGKADPAMWLDVSTLLGHVDDMVDGYGVVREQSSDGRWLFCLRHCVDMEQAVASWALYMRNESPLYDGTAKGLTRDIEAYYEENGFVDAAGNASVDGFQMMAVMNALLNRVSIVTGGPGRGKTQVASCICDCWNQCMHAPIYLTSYTGKATARLAELVDADECRVVVATMASLLVNPSVTPDTFNGALVIIDEASMVDAVTMGHFTKYLDGAQVVVIGDANQLPSIGNGQVFRDLIESGVLPVTELVTCYRAKDSQTLVDNGDAIVEGRIGDVKYDDAFSWSASSSSSVFDDIVLAYMGLVTGKGALEPSQVCLLGAFKSEKDPLSVVKLNLRIREELNPLGKPVPGSSYYGSPLRIGDRVLIVRNMRDIGVVNGDTGHIVTATADGWVRILLDNNRMVDIPFADMCDVELGYALTVHKSQGSEYSRVLLAVSPRMTQTWARNFATRNLMYTAVTRAKDGVLLFGSEPAFAACLANEMAPRLTRLPDYLAAGTD